MISLANARRLSGGVALITFAVMAGWSLFVFGPAIKDGMLPQSTLTGYTDAELAEMSQSLGERFYPAYRFMLAYVDTIFLLSFAAFTALMLWRIAPRIGLLLGALYALTDFTENRLILSETDKPFSPGGWQQPLPVPTNISNAFWFTADKFMLVAACLIAIFIAWRRERR